MRYVLALLCLMTVLTGCSHAPPDYVSNYTPPPSADPVRGTPIAIIGDAYTGGSPMGGRGRQGWPALVAAKLRSEGLAVQTDVAYEVGAGYAAPGIQRARVFADLIPVAVRSDDGLVVLFGSRSDMNFPADQLTSAVQRTLTDARAAAPEAKLVIIGPPWVNAIAPTGVMQARDVVRAQAGAVGATFVDPIAEGWFVDRPDLIGKDGVNPTSQGHAYMADEIAPVIAQQLQAPPAP